MEFSAFQPMPRLPTSRSERRWIAVIVLVLTALFGAELLSNFTTEKLGAVFVALFWGPALLVHELGHAGAARMLGWHVSEIVLGFGREISSFRVGKIRVRVKLLPVEGYVVPHPQDMAQARLKSALIYAAGPGAELSVILLLWLWQGSALFERAETMTALVAQSAAVAAAIGAIFNLLPFPTQDGVSDGLGIIVSLFAPQESFRARLVLPFISEARRALYREQPARAAEAIEAGFNRSPDDWQLHALHSVATAMRGEVDESFEALETLGHPDDKPPAARVELLLAAAWVTLLGDQKELFSQAEAACLRALDSAPADSRALLLLGRLKLERGLAEESCELLLRGYAGSREAEEEAHYCAYLVLACTQSGKSEHAARFMAALDRNLLGPALRQRVAPSRV